MIVLLDVAGASVTFAAVFFVWLARRLWLFWDPGPQKATVTCQVVRPIPPPQPVPGRPAPAIVTRAVIRGELEQRG
jgi:hypothetical protein